MGFTHGWLEEPQHHTAGILAGDLVLHIQEVARIADHAELASAHVFAELPCIFHRGVFVAFAVDEQYRDVDIIMQMLLLGYRLVEVPAVMHPRVEGKSMHSGLKPIMYMFRMMFSIIAVWIGIKLFKIDEEVSDEE